MDLDHEENEIDNKVDEIALRELCSYINVSLFEQAFIIKSNLLVNDLKIIVHDENRLKERNKQLSANMTISKRELFNLNVKYNNVAIENK